MVSSSYHESLWEGVPEGADPPDLLLRRTFLLEHAERVRARVARGDAAPADGALAEAGRGDAGRGDAGRGDAGRGDARRGDVEAGSQRMRVLDVGCGEAQLTAELARAGFAVMGVDVAEEPLRRARRRHPELDLRVVPAAGAWPLQDAGFDVVWAGETIEHVADTVGWLSEVRRVLCSGGSLLLSTPAHGRLAMLVLALSGRRFDAHFDPRADHLRFYTRRTLSRLLEDFGFEDLEVRAAGGVPGARRVLLAAAVRSRF